MLDRLIRRLGYVPASSMRLLPDGAAQSVSSDPHLLHADGFDRARAKVDALCAWHEDGDGFHYAIGQDNWAPLAVAGFCLSTNDECRTWLNEALRARAWIEYDMLASWHRSNRAVLHGFGVKIEVSGPHLRLAGAAADEREIVPSVRANEMAELFALAWKRHHPVSPFQRLGNSVAYDTLSGHHSLRLAFQTNEHVLERVVEWVAFWLEARGLNVDREEQLVHLPGYQPLYYRTDAAMWP